MQQVFSALALIITIYFSLFHKLQAQPSGLAKPSIDFVFSQLYVNKYDIIAQDSAPTKIKTAKKANLVFVSSGMEGIMVINALTNTIITQQSFGMFINTLDVTSDGDFVFTSIKGMFVVLSFQDRKSFVTVSQLTYPTSITDIVIDHKEKRVFAVGMGGIVVAYDVQNKTNIIQLTTFNANSVVVHQACVSPDDNWLLLANDERGLSILKITISTSLANSSTQNLNNYALTLTLAAQGIGFWKVVGTAITDDMTYIYSIENWYGVYICGFANIQSADPSLYPIPLNLINFWPFEKISPTTYTLALLENSNYLCVGVRSQGIFIFNIKDRMNPVIFQTIPVGENALSIQFSPNEDYIYYSNGLSVYIFQKVPLNLNNKYPNLFNVQQSYFQYTSVAYYKWRCEIKSIGQDTYFFGAFDWTGVFIFNITNPYYLQQVYTQAYKASSLVDSLNFSNDLQYLIVPIEEDNTSLIVYDLTDVSNPKDVFRFKMEIPNHDEIVYVSRDGHLIALTYDDGVLLLDSSQMPEISLLFYWKKFVYMSGENAGVILTNDNKYLISSVRGYGFYALSVNLNDPDENILTWQYTLQTLGGEGIVCSIFNNEYAYIFDGFRGVGVLDLTALPILKVISRVSLQGWANLIIPIQNDNFLIVAQLDVGMISLIDSSDKTDLQLISQFLYENESAQSICITPDYNYLYINNNFGTLMLPLQTKIMIQTEIQQMITSSEGFTTYTPLQGNSFTVGEHIQMKFLMLFPVEGSTIIETYYYSNYQIYNLPFWIVFDNNNQDLIISVDKTGLQNANSTNTQNIILLKTVLPLGNSSFIFNLDDGNSTSPSDSSQIFSILKQQQVITSQSYVSDTFDFTETLQISLNNTILPASIQQAIRQTLQMSIFINQVLFYVSPSLKLDISNPTTPIQTLSSDVQVFFEVEGGVGQFLISNFQGVIVSSSSNQNQLKLEGSLDNINSALAQQVIFASKQDPSKVNVTISIIDNLNYSLTQVALVSKCKMIKQKENIQKNPKSSLQSQFDNKYLNGVVDIQTLFSIEFSQDTFTVGDVSSFNMVAYLLQGNQTSQIQSDSWVQFHINNDYATLEGTPPESLLYKQITIRIVANDGYTQTYDDFTISIYGIPFLYVFNILLQILGPTIALIKLYFSRHIFLNCIYKKRVTFSKEYVSSGKLFQKRFVLMGDDMRKCIFLFQAFLICVNNSRPMKKSQNSNSEFKLNNLEENNIEKSNNLEKSISKSLDKPAGQEDYQDKDHLNSKGSPANKYFKRIQSQLQKQSLVSKVKQNDKSSENEYINQNDGTIKMKRIYEQIEKSKLTFTLNGKSYKGSSFSLDFQNKESRIFKGLQALAARYFLKKDYSSYQVYKFLRKHALQNNEYTFNDWYRSYVSIHPTYRIDKYGVQVAFPDLSLKQIVINTILGSIYNQNKVLSIDTAKDFGINFNLIKLVLYSDSLGLVSYKPRTLQPCIGESIHLHSYHIRGIQTYKEVSESRFTTLRKFLNIEYEEYGTSKNRSLPSWLNMEHNNGVILLTGIPMSQDVEEILIRVTDSHDYVIKQFRLKVIPSALDENNTMTQENELSNGRRISAFSKSLSSKFNRSVKINDQLNRMSQNKLCLTKDTNNSQECFLKKDCQNRSDNFQPSNTRQELINQTITKEIRRSQFLNEQAAVNMQGLEQTESPPRISFQQREESADFRPAKRISCQTLSLHYQQNPFDELINNSPEPISQLFKIQKNESSIIKHKFGQCSDYSLEDIDLNVPNNQDNSIQNIKQSKFQFQSDIVVKQIKSTVEKIEGNLNQYL